MRFRFYIFKIFLPVFPAEGTINLRPTLKTMKKLIIIALFIIAAATFAFSQKKSEPFEKTNAEAQKVVQYMFDWANFSNKKDAAALERLLPDDLVITFQDGEVLTKTEYIAQFKANRSDYKITYLEQKVDLFNDDVAVLRAIYLVEIGEASIQFRTTVTFLKRKKQWQAVAFHSSPLIKK